jgi:hypothetical protein
MTGMSDDELRARLARLDPAPAGSPVDPVTSPRAREMVERAMNAPELQTLDVPTDDLAARRRRRWLLPAAAAVLVAVVVGVVVSLSGGGGGDTPGEDPTTLALSLPAPDAAGSCVVFDVAFLAEMPVAFAGSVTAVGADQVTLDVDHWYRGGDADQVTVAVPSQQSSAALDGVDFRQGERYLITATDGTVNGCGFSGPADPQLEQAFEQAFGS